MYKFLRDIPNPYNHTAEIKDSKFFTGRKKELDLVLGKIDDFLEHGQKSNFIITGDKSIGKSSFLNILKEKLESKGVLVAHLILTQNKVDENLLFFKELIDVIFDGGAKNDYLNQKSSGEYTEREIWEELTDNAEYQNFKDKTHLYFAKAYANSLIKNNVNINISEVNLIKDFRWLVGSAKEYGFRGMLIMIDEFQLLASNDTLIQMIQRLLDEVENLPFILSGNYLIRGDSFQKIIRKSEPIELLPLKPTDIHDLIYKPLNSFGFTREEINENLDRVSFKYLFRKGEYNPYYVNLIMHHVFDRYRKKETDKIVLDSEIIFAIISKLKSIATHHERITSQLNASSIEQLEALNRLFYYQNINLDDIALLELSFKDYSEEEYSEVLRKIKSDLLKIIPLKLYKFNNEPAIESFIELPNPTRNQAAEVKYCFDGDNIDELYMSQLIESRIKKDLPRKSHADIYEHFSERLISFLLDTIMKRANLPSDRDNLEIQVSYSFLESAKEAEICSATITNKIEILRDKANKSNLTPEDFSEIQNSLSETSLHEMPFFAIEDEENWAYCYYFVKAQIREKVVKYEITVPIKMADLDDFVLYNQEVFDTAGLLKLYNIEILDSIVIPIQPKVIFFLKFIDIRDLDVIMMRRVYRGDFEEAIRYYNILNHLTKELMQDNNLGFLYMNKGDLDIAGKYLNNVRFKETVTHCNLAYICYLKGNLKNADQHLSEAMKKSKNSKKNIRIFKVMNQILLPLQARKDLPSTFDLAITPGEEIIIVGNRAMIASFDGQDYGLGLLKKVDLVGDFDSFYKIRYEYFINYNLNRMDQIEGKVTELQKLINENNAIDYFSLMLEEDRKVLGI